MSTAHEDIGRNPLDDQERLTGYAGVVSSITLISRVTGFVRDVVIANAFGAEFYADAFFVAFGIPNLMRRLFAEGGLTVSFVPVFTERLKNRGKKEAGELWNAVFTQQTIVLILVSIVGVAAAHYLVLALVPGFAKIPGKLEMTTLLTRITFPYILFIGLASTASGVLNSMGSFAVPAFNPVFLNLTIIGFALLVAPRLDIPVVAIAMGVMVGGVAQFLVQYPSLSRRGMRPSLRFRWRGSGSGRVVALMGPALVGLGAGQINIMIDRWLASFLPGGSVSYLYYGNRLVQFPTGVFAVAMGVATLPVMSGQMASRMMDKMKETLNFSLRLVLFLVVPCSVILMVLGLPIINVLFQRGEFTLEASHATNLALFYYAVGLFAIAGVRVVVPAFYSMQDTATPTKVAVAAMGVNVVFNLLLMGPLKHGGLALATSISSIFNFMVLFYVLRGRIGPLGLRKVVKSLIRISVAAGIMGCVCGGLSWRFFSLEASLGHRMAFLIVNLFLGGLIYLLISFALKSEELIYLYSLLRGRASRVR